MEKQLKPEIVVTQFSETAVHEYIDKLELITDAFGPEQPIVLKIDSYGGAAYGLIMLLEHLKTMPNPIATYTISKAMSAGAFLLSIGGSKGLRMASPHSTIMVHEIQAGAMGDMKELEQQMGTLVALNERILTMFAHAIGLKTASDVRALIKSRSVGHDLTISALEAQQLGFIDKVGYMRIEPNMRFDLHMSLVGAKPEKTKPAKKKRRPGANK
jgi:ATP-dependent Clp endopeptidase proteolytic subunit ClpP